MEDHRQPANDNRAPKRAQALTVTLIRSSICTILTAQDAHDTSRVVLAGWAAGI